MNQVQIFCGGRAAVATVRKDGSAVCGQCGERVKVVTDVAEKVAAL